MKMNGLKGLAAKVLLLASLIGVSGGVAGCSNIGNPFEYLKNQYDTLQNRYVKGDKTAPTVSITEPSGLEAVVNTDINFKSDAEDNEGGTGVKKVAWGVYKDGESAVSESDLIKNSDKVGEILVYKFTSAGKYKIKCAAQDNAGNISDAAFKEITVKDASAADEADTIAPTSQGLEIMTRNIYPWNVPLRYYTGDEIIIIAKDCFDNKELKKTEIIYALGNRNYSNLSDFTIDWNDWVTAEATSPYHDKEITVPSLGRNTDFRYFVKLTDAAGNTGHAKDNTGRDVNADRPLHFKIYATETDARNVLKLRLSAAAVQITEDVAFDYEIGGHYIHTFSDGANTALGIRFEYMSRKSNDYDTTTRDNEFLTYGEATQLDTSDSRAGIANLNRTGVTKYAVLKEMDPKQLEKIMGWLMESNTNWMVPPNGIFLDLY